MELTNKRRLYPTKAQERVLFSHADHSKHLWDEFVMEGTERYQVGKGFLNDAEMNSRLVALRQDHAYYAEMPRSAQRGVIMKLYRALTHPTNRLPTKKDERDRSCSIIYVDFGKWNGKTVRLPKVGKVRWRGRELPAKLASEIKVFRAKNGNWYGCVSYKVSETKPNRSGEIVGVDLNADCFALSNGKKHIVPPMKNLCWLVAKRNRILARREKGSGRWRKMRRLIARTHDRIARKRDAFLHQTAGKILAVADGVCIEDLAVKNMTRKGKHKRGLNRVVRNAAFGKTRRLLEYKAKIAGVPVFVANTFFPSSKICFHCGKKNPNLGAEKRWTCPYCDKRLDRDNNSSLNLALEGVRIASGLGAKGAWSACKSGARLKPRCAVRDEARSILTPQGVV